MWIMLNDAFLSIVAKDCGPTELLVRARRPGDIQRVFPDARVARSTDSDYLFRAIIPRDDVAEAMETQLNGVTYGNFKDSVKDVKLHDAYLQVWSAMADLQDPPPYSTPYQARKEPA